MTEDSFYLGAYWAARGESLGDCATRTVQFLKFLEGLHPAFAYWIVANNEPIPSPKIELTISRFETLLEPLYNDLGQRMDDMGYSVMLWNDIPDCSRGAGIHVSCGASSKCSRSVNVCVLDFPRHAQTIHDLLAPDVVLRLVSQVADVFEPDWAIVTSTPLREALYVSLPHPFVGIATFLSSRRFAPPRKLPPQSVYVEVPDHGFVIALAEERFGGLTPEYLKTAKKVHKRFRREGYFRVLR